MSKYAGLSSDIAAEIMREAGPNRLKSKKKASAAKIFAGQFKDVMVMILLAATAVSAFMGEIYDAVTIIIIVIMDAVLGFIQEYRTERTLEALEKLTSPTAKVYRDGVLREINAEEVVPGDIFAVEAGDRIPADGKILEASGLMCDEATLTGESGSVKKEIYSEDDLSPNPGMLYMGCSCVRGSGVCEVTQTGMKTQMGSVSGMIGDQEEQKTPLQRKLGRLGGVLCAICIAVCAVVALAGILRGEPLFDMLMTGITIAIAAIPEGLPATVTISLALAVRRMLKQNALVHRLHSVETLGCTTVICTDKTGTLTENKMTVTEIFSGGRIYNLSGSGYSAKGKITEGGRDLSSLPYPLSETLLCGALCGNAKIIPVKSDSSDRERKSRLSFDIVGDPTEAALLIAAEKCGADRSGAEKISENPFDSDRKFMSATVRTRAGVKIFTKGAPDIVLGECRFILTDSGIGRLSNADKKALRDRYEDMAARALRVLAAAEESPEGRIFLGFFGMMDAPREEALRSVKECRRAGIKVVMITGDHLLTASAIAKEAGILRPGLRAVSKEELDMMDDRQLSKEADGIAVYARVTPGDKLRIVNALKSRGHTVAMTGDGVNDAPAIKASDIGVAMGKTGTDVAKQAADIILLDDDFSTLTLAVKQGRTVFSNIRKLVRYLISCNIGEVMVMFLSIVMGLPVVLLPAQILLVNLVTDGLPAVALGLEKPEDGIMKKKPKDFSGSFAGGGLTARIIIRGILIGGCTLGCFMYYLRTGFTLECARTAALLTLIVSQLIHVFECRSEEKSVFAMNPFSNPALCVSVMISALALAACISVPALSNVMSTSMMGLYELLPALIFSIAVPTVCGLLQVIFGKKE